jgi:hypothetical protein
MKRLPASILLVLLAVHAPPAALGAAQTVHWTCTTTLLPDYKASVTNDPDVGEGVAYVYVGDRHLHTNYAVEATVTAPTSGRRGWYDTSIRLGPLIENEAYVQVDVSHWRRFDYRPHVAIAWSLPHGASSGYKDTGIMLDDRPHRLGIAVRGDLLRLLVDGSMICSTRASYFVSTAARTYFQIRTETSAPGTNSGARVANLRLKRDIDTALRPYASDCIMHRHGIFWQYMGAGSYAARGAFYPDEATFFTGLDPETACRI